jgi:signal transduction histidine kinase
MLKDSEIKNLIQNSELRSKSAMAEGQENERQRISRELHDRVGSMLSLAKLNLSACDDGENPVIQQNIELLNQTYQEVRNISHNLYSGVVKNLGLKVALFDLKKTIESHNTIQFNLFFYDENLSFSKETEEVVYRVMQELITNVLKHAHASCLDIQVNSAEDGMVLITVEDDGKGFDPQQNSEGIGLANIRYRLSLIGGSVEINSSPGRGACFLLNVPIESKVLS